MISDQSSFLVQAMLYAVQFERDPCDGIARLLALSERKRLGGTPHELLAAIVESLASDEELAKLIPQPHSETEVRRFLAAMADAIRVQTTRS